MTRQGKKWSDDRLTRFIHLTDTRGVKACINFLTDKQREREREERVIGRERERERERECERIEKKHK